MDSPLAQDALISTAEVAGLLGLAPITIAKMRLRGDGPPFVRLGRAVRYRPSVVLAWAETRTHRSTSAATVAVEHGEVA